jgi:hypothetical protein
MKARNVLTADYEFNDTPLPVGDIPGLMDTVREVAETKEKTLVRCEGRVCDYDVYWNSKTDTVRIAAVVPGASYEVPQEELDKQRLGDYTEEA